MFPIANAMILNLNFRYNLITHIALYGLRRVLEERAVQSGRHPPRENFGKSVVIRSYR